MILSLISLSMERRVSIGLSPSAKGAEMSFVE